MPTIAESARIPAGMDAFRALLAESACDTSGTEIIDRSLAAIARRAAAQRHVASRPTRPDERDVRDSKVWNNYVEFMRLIEERPLHARGKHNGSRPWAARDARRVRSDVPGGQGLAGRSPGEHVIATRQHKIEWLPAILPGARGFPCTRAAGTSQGRA